jgi:hypothetical protein
MRLTLALMALLGSFACQPHTNVLVVGLDGADWDVLDPLMDGGHVPALEGVIRGGARADFDCTPAWPAFSCYCPPVWVSIATGQPESVHGIRNLSDPSSARRAPALWTVVGDNGGWSGLSSWRNTSPPEAGNQFVLTEIGNTVAGAVNYRTWGSPEPPAAPVTPAMPENLYHSLGLLPFTEDRPGDVIGVMAKDRVAMKGTSRMSIFTLLLGALAHRPTLTMITIHAIDKSQHVGWGYVQDAMGEPVNRARIESVAELWKGPVFGPQPFAVGTIASQYLEADRWLGNFLSNHDFHYVVLVSDHGMTRNNGPGLSGLHGPQFSEAHVGIFAIRGPGVIPGTRLEDVDVLDVAPTLAWLMDIPVAEDLPGRLLTEAFDEDFVDGHPVQWTQSW